MTDDYYGHGIRLDVDLADEAGTVYNVEVQNANKHDIERRVRYYQSAIDRRLIKKTEKYSKLPDIYMVFVCPFDYYGKGYTAYERVSYISPFSDKTFDDGSHVYILNAVYSSEYVADEYAKPELVEYLSILTTHEQLHPEQMTGELARAVAAKVEDIRHDKTKEEPYMTFERRISEERYAALVEGRAEGRAEGAFGSNLDAIRNIAKGFGVSYDKAMDTLQIPANEREGYLERLKS